MTRSILYDKLAYCTSLLGGKAYVREIITINYYRELKYNLPSLKRGGL